MNPIDWISAIIKPVKGILDKIVMDKGEKERLNNELSRIQMDMMRQALDYETQRMKTQADIVKAEAQGEGWLQKNWRPVVMLVFTALIVARWMGWVAPNLSPSEYESLWTIVEVGLGGYVIGRTVEKVAPVVSEAINKGRSERKGRL